MILKGFVKGVLSCRVLFEAVRINSLHAVLDAETRLASRRRTAKMPNWTGVFLGRFGSIRFPAVVRIGFALQAGAGSHYNA
jgi:hypothetical protein